MDTVAVQEQEQEGPWEVEVSYGGEADLHQHLNGCVKNPGHQKFVPVDQFNVEHLPPGCRDNDLVDYVRALSDLTVRVSVEYVSVGRPDTVPGSDKPYLFCKYRGKNMFWTGTGWVWGVVRGVLASSRTCKCQECLDSPTPKTRFAEIYIVTAAHVVYDELEAAHTTCHFFFDKGRTPRACSGVLELSGWSLKERMKEGDWCRMVHMTHDLALADLLEKRVTRRAKLSEKVNNKYRRLKFGGRETSSPLGSLREVWKKVINKCRGLKSEEQEASSPSEYLPEVWDNLTIIVSHPHGCSKQISVGYCTGKGGEGSFLSWTKYTTATCPGSSGARVFVMGDGGSETLETDHLHCGDCKDDKNMNYSNDSLL